MGYWSASLWVRTTVAGVGLLAGGCGGPNAPQNAPRDATPDATEPPATPAPISIAGRWGLFVFEDPIAVELVQTGSQLSGLGCDSGLPTADYNPAHALCAPLRGEVTGNRAWFEFAIESLRVHADVTIAVDGSRLSGLASFGSLATLGVALLPFSKDELWLPFPNDAEHPSFHADESFELREASDGGTDYQPNQVYDLHRQNRGMWGDFGVFWHTEMSFASDDVPIQVGPVSATAPGQPISLAMEHNGGGITRIVAVTATGARYVFGRVQR